MEISKARVDKEADEEREREEGFVVSGFPKRMKVGLNCLRDRCFSPGL